MPLKLIALAFTLSVSLIAPNASTPHITGVAPATVISGPNAQPVTVIGTGFMKGLSLSVTSPAGGSQVFKDVDVQAQEEATFRVSVVLATPGAYTFTVTNTDGGVSQPFRFDVPGPRPAAGPMAPVIDTITPSKGSKQNQPQVFHIEGKRFVQGLTVMLSDPAGNSTTISGTSIANLTANAFDVTLTIQVEGEHELRLTNPDGRSSNVVNLSVRR